MFFLCVSGVMGSVSVDDAIAVSKGRFRALAHGPVEDATVEHMEGLLLGMRGEFDEGLRTLRKTRATFASSA